MTLDQFEINMVRLRTEYSTKAYSKERTMIIWGVVKYIDGEAFYDVITVLIGDNHKPVSLQQIKDATRPLREEAFRLSQNQKLEGISLCELCKNTGVVMAKDEAMIEYAFRCNCKVGNIKNVPFPAWNSSQKFKVISQGIHV